MKLAPALAAAALLLALTGPASATTITLSTVSSDGTPASQLDASLDFSVSGSTLTLTLQNTGTDFSINCVWFNGGRQWNIVDSYMNTLTYREFHQVLARGGVIGGSSAGATIQGDYLVRGAIAGPEIMMTPEKEHERGFRFLRRSAVDQHINTRNRWDDLIPVIQKMPDLLGIGLSEGTAIIVNGDRFEVVGKWKVAVHDNTRLYQPWEKPYFVLSAGDVYNMNTRKIEKLR